MKKVRGQKAERTREAKRALLHSALDIIGESGLAGLTLAQVGIRAGYSRGLVQYHYGSKEALISALVGWAVRGGQQMLRDNMTRGVDSVLHAIDAYNLARKEYPKNLRGFWVLSAEMGYSTNPAFRHQIEEYQKYLRKSFAEAFEEEGISSARAEPIATIILAGMRGLIQEWIAEEDLDVDTAFNVLKESIRDLVAMAKESQEA
ncbi:MAG: TetR/AcrR family transcriptional regulator [Porticoccaceae bacterium]|nr:TetR/AcrR family transcriptional regulator [Porticoccaceae bacterium]